MSKPVKTIVEIVSQGTTIPKGTVGSLATYAGKNLSPLTFGTDIENNTIKVVFLSPAITIGLPIDKLGQFIQDVSIDTVVTAPS